MPDKPVDSCSTCKFWHGTKAYSFNGETRKHADCRRFPPVFPHPGESHDFPQVSELDWCGEWQVKPK
jgi:hypothetical protein